MSYLELKYNFFILLATTLILYFIFDVLKYKIENQVKLISEYINDNKIFEIPFIKVEYAEFSESITVKNYIKNYEYLSSKKDNSSLTPMEEKAFQTLEEDIKLLNISFLSSIVLNNKESVAEELYLKIKKFISIIKLAQIIKILKLILTLVCLVLFLKLVF